MDKVVGREISRSTYIHLSILFLRFFPKTVREKKITIRNFPTSFNSFVVFNKLLLLIVIVS